MSKQSSNMVEQITVRLNGEISGFQNALNKAQKSVNDFGSSDSAKKFDTTLTQISKKMSDIYTKNNQPNKTMGTFKTMENQVSNVGLELDQLSKKLDNLDAKQKLSLLPAGEGEKLQKALQTLKEIERLDKTRKTQAVGRKVELTREKEALEAKGAKEISRKEIVRERREKYQKTAEARRSELQKNISDYEKQAQAAKEYSEALNKVNELERKRSQEGLTDKQKSSLDDKIKVAKEKMPAEATAPTGNIEYWRKQLDELDQKYEANGSKLKELNKEIRAYNIEVDKNKKALEEVDNELTDTSKAYEQLKYKLAEAGLSVEQLEKELKLDPGTIKTYDDLKLRINELVSQGLGKADVLVNDFKNEVNELSQKNRELGQSTREATSSIEQENEALRRVDGIKSRIQQFLGLQGVMQVARRAMQNAYQTIKDLDAAMTEMATVTDLGVGDYWEQLPEYTKRANELGVAIKDTYEAATLYYQQGLKTNEVVSISNETLKMARIAGLSAEDATNKMTAALRGFNMELNETSAKRISDVYSELAAITASDTKEISNAMTKTASIASNAGMEFETTAAFLSQIIETTRESAETAGTALKTVIARFQELKKDPAEIGEVDGEVVDANKIETALRSVGVALRDTDGQFRDLDEVFLELASKWKGLDTNTQRYIATIAAGSRQQSRFIAMMSDYGRTQQLVAAANNSAGASNVQFEKTLESLASKLNRLKNAWDSFTMGIMDDELVKGGIDLLTGLLETVNKLTDALPGLSGSLAKVGIVLGGMSLGKKAAFSLLGQAGKQWRGETANESIISGQVWSSFAGFKTHRGLFRDRTSTMTNNDSVAIEIAQYEKLKQTYGEWMAIKSSGDAAAVQSAKARFQAARVETAALQGLTNKEKELIVEKLHEGVITSEQISILGKETAVRALNQGKTKQQGKELEKLSLLKQIEGKASGLQIRALGAETIAKALNAESTEEQSEELILLNKVRSIEAGLTPFQKQMLDQETLARAVQQEAVDQQGKELNQLNQARAAEKNLTTGGFFTVMMTEIGLRVSGKTATDAETAAIWKKIDAKKAEMVTNLKSQKYMLKGIGVTLAYIAAVALIAYGIYSAVKAYEEFEGAQEKAIEDARKSMEEFREQADEAKQSLDSIADEKSNLEELQKTFEGLTKGTTEWKEALVDINSKVLDLIETYPELAGYVSMGEGGAMTISEAGWDAIAESQQNKYEAAVYGQTTAALQKSVLEQQAAFEKIYETNTAGQQYVRDPGAMHQAVGAGGAAVGLATGIGAGLTGAKIGAVTGAWLGPIGAAIGVVVGAAIGAGIAAETDNWGSTQEEREKQATGGLTAEDYNNYAVKLAKEGVSISGGSTKEDFRKVFETMGFDSDVDFEDVFTKIQVLGSEFDELATDMLKYKTAQETYLETLAQTAVADNKDLVESDLYNSIVNASADAMKDEQKQMSKDIEAMMNDKDYVNDGEATDKLIKEYAEIQDITESEVRELIENEKLSARTMVEAIKQKPVIDETSKFATTLFEKMDGLKPDARGLAKGITSAGGGELTGKQLRELQQKATKDYGVDSLTKLTNDQISELLEAFGISLEELGIEVDTVRESFEAENTQRNISEKLTGLGISEKTQDDLAKYTTDYVEAIANQLFRSGTKMLSGDNAEQVLQGILEFMPEDEEKVGQFVNAISSLDDMGDVDKIQSLSETMIELGIITEDQRDKFNSLEDNMIKLGAAIKKVDMESITEEFLELEKTKESILAGTFEREMTTEQKNKYENQDQFIQIGPDSWLYTGDPNGLVEKTWKTRSNSMDDQLQQKIDTYNEATRGSEVELEITGLSVSKNLNEGANKEVSDIRNAFEQYKQGEIDYAEYLSVLRKADKSVQLTKTNLTNYLTSAGYSEEEIEEIRKSLINKDKNGIFSLENLPEKVMLDILPSYLKNNYDYVRDGIGYNYSVEGENVKPITVDDIVSGAVKIKGRDALSEGDTVISPDELENIFNQVASAEQKKGLTPYTKETRGWYKHIFDILTLYSEKEVENAKDAVATELNKLNLYGLTPQEILDFIPEGVDETEFQAELDKKRRTALENQIVGEGGQFIYQDFEKQIGDDDVVKALTVSYVKLSDAFSAAGNGLNQFQETLVASKRGTREYKRDMSKVVDSLSSLYNINIDEDWANENKELIEGVVAGHEQAIEVLTDYIALQQAADFASQTGVSISSDTLKQLEEYIDSLADGEAVSLSFQQIIDKFPELAEMEEEQLTSLIPLMQAFNVAMNVGADGAIALTKIDTSGFFEGLSGGKVEEWENPYDWLYNYNEKINSQLREREKIEKRISKLLADDTYNYAEVEAQTRKQLENLKASATVQKNQYDYAKQEMGLLFSQNPDLSKYASYDYATGEVMVDYAALERDQGTLGERGPVIEEMIGRVEELRGVMQDSEDALEEIEEDTQAIYDNAAQGASEMYNVVKEALVYREQQKIDEYEAMSEAISEAESKLVDTLQEQIDLQRQIRDNQEKSDELADKRTRLAYLRRDTSGANALEIAALEKELAQGEQDMEDTLVDQAIQNLQDTNERAAEQRQTQIDIANAQLEIWSNSAEIWTTVEREIAAMQSQIATGVPIDQTAMGELIATSQGIENLNPVEKADDWKKITGQAENYELYKSLATEGGSLHKIFETTKNDTASALAGIGEVKGILGEDHWNGGKVERGYLKDIADFTKNGKFNNNFGDSYKVNIPRINLISDKDYRKLSDEDKLEYLQDIISELPQSDRPALSTYYRAEEGRTIEALEKILIPLLKQYGYGGISLAYATGGLADFTGPAWLDGTPSKPEYVLNAAQTQKFFELVDVAESLDLQQLFGNNNKSESKGDSYFDIDINVDSIGEDYDVEQIADKIKQLIYNDATYRNVNAVRKFN